MMGVLLSACWLMAGCSVIDDDLSDCKEDVKQYQMEYQLRLITNMTTELETQLQTMTEYKVRQALEAHLGDIFKEYAHDVDLSFYDTEGKMVRLQHDQHNMEAKQSSYTLTLPMRKYMHLAVANIDKNNVIDLVNDESGFTSSLRQASPTTTSGNPILPSHTTGLFTARQPMEVLEGINQTFNVKLYMANSAAILVLNPKGHSYTDLKVYSTGFANDFLIKDSTYVYESTSTMIVAQQVETGNDLVCYCSVNYPSRDAAPASVKKRTGGGTSLWQFKVYVTNTDGKITETVLDIEDPLKAGDMKVIKGELDDDGAVRPYDSTVGVSVKLDWGDGGNYNPDL